MYTEPEKKRKSSVESVVKINPQEEPSDPHKHPRWHSNIRTELARRKVEELLTQMKDGSPIVIYTGDSLYTALGTMITDKISAVPVMDKQRSKKCVGFVDMMDVMSATINLLETGPAAAYFENLVGKHKADSVEKNVSHRERLKKAADEDDESTTVELLEQMIVESISAQSIADYSTVDNFCNVPNDMSMLKAAEELIKSNQQRLAVHDQEAHFMGVISQSGFMEWISEEFTELMKHNQRRKVGDIKLHSKLFYVSPETPAFEAFKKMKDERVHSLAVVSSKGLLIDVISAKDLMLWNEWIAAGEVLRFSTFSNLKSSVSRYLEDSRAQREIPKRSPITCTKKSHLDEVIADMLFNNVHSVYVLDEVNTPLGVLSYADIIADMIRES